MTMESGAVCVHPQARPVTFHVDVLKYWKSHWQDLVDDQALEVDLNHPLLGKNSPHQNAVVEHANLRKHHVNVNLSK